MTMLRTATGKEIPCDFMAKADDLILYVKVQMDLVEAMKLFQNPEETKVLEWINDNGEAVHCDTGFIKFSEIHIMTGACPVRIRMEKDIDTLIMERAEQLLRDRQEGEPSA